MLAGPRSPRQLPHRQRRAPLQHGGRRRERVCSGRDGAWRLQLDRQTQHAQLHQLWVPLQRRARIVRVQRAQQQHRGVALVLVVNQQYQAGPLALQAKGG
jgi:hypothetical protein